MPRAGTVADRGHKVEYIDKRISMRGASWVEPSGAAILFDDFFATITAGFDAVGVQSTSGTVFAASTTAGGADGGHGGWVRGVTGTGDDDCEMLVGERLGWTTLNLGNSTLVFETRIVLPVITTVGVCAGFTDAITEAAAGNLFNIPSGDVPTGIPADGAAWTFDTDGTTDVFYGVGVTNTTFTTYAAAAVGVAPPTDDPFVLRLEIDSGQVGYFSMSRVPSGYTAGDGVGPLEYAGAVGALGRSTIAMAPFISVTARATTDNLALECDYIFVAAARSIK
mgnify:CR=1 FL=1